ncbi:hypothetical protein Leryth_007433, partial [Lithospermum erythrorhizon]
MEKYFSHTLENNESFRTRKQLQNNSKVVKDVQFQANAEDVNHSVHPSDHHPIFLLASGDVYSVKMGRFGDSNYQRLLKEEKNCLKIEYTRLHTEIEVEYAGYLIRQ